MLAVFAASILFAKYQGAETPLVIGGRLAYTKTHIISIASDQFPKYSGGQALVGAEKSSKDFAESLARSQGTKPPILIHGARATRQNIFKTLENLPSSEGLTVTDRLIVQITLHGEIKKSRFGTEKGYLVAFDSDAEERDGEVNAIAVQDLIAVLTKLPYKSCLLILDTCGTGGILDGKTAIDRIDPEEAFQPAFRIITSSTSKSGLAITNGLGSVLMGGLARSLAQVEKKGPYWTDATLFQELLRDQRVSEAGLRPGHLQAEGTGSVPFAPSDRRVKKPGDAPRLNTTGLAKAVKEGDFTAFEAIAGEVYSGGGSAENLNALARIALEDFGDLEMFRRLRGGGSSSSQLGIDDQYHAAVAVLMDAKLFGSAPEIEGRLKVRFPDLSRQDVQVLTLRSLFLQHDAVGTYQFLRKNLLDTPYVKLEVLRAIAFFDDESTREQVPQLSRKVAEFNDSMRLRVGRILYSVGRYSLASEILRPLQNSTSQWCRSEAVALLLPSLYYSCQFEQILKFAVDPVPQDQAESYFYKAEASKQLGKYEDVDVWMAKFLEIDNCALASLFKTLGSGEKPLTTIRKVRELIDQGQLRKFSMRLPSACLGPLISASNAQIQRKPDQSPELRTIAAQLQVADALNGLVQLYVFGSAVDDLWFNFLLQKKVHFNFFNLTRSFPLNVDPRLDGTVLSVLKSTPALYLCRTDEVVLVALTPVYEKAEYKSKIKDLADRFGMASLDYEEPLLRRKDPLSRLAVALLRLKDEDPKVLLKLLDELETSYPNWVIPKRLKEIVK